MDNLSTTPNRSLLDSFSENTNVLVVGAQGGIGQALLNFLSRDPVVGELHAWSRRSPDSVDGAINHSVVDITNEESIVAAAADIERLELIIIATGLLRSGDAKAPEKAIKDISIENLSDNFLVNVIGPALVAKHLMPTLPRRGRAVISSLSAKVGSIEDNRLGGWYSYRASKAALNQFLKTFSIELTRTRPDAIAVALHPGTVDTPLSRPFQKNVPPEALFSPEYAASCLLNVINTLTVADSGRLIAFDGELLPY